MSELELYLKLSYLTPDLKAEANDFIEFLLSKKKKGKASVTPQFGCAKGKIKVSKDFDEPLADFKEYME